MKHCVYSAKIQTERNQNYTRECISPPS